jgi:hypothetical protein
MEAKTVVRLSHSPRRSWPWCSVALMGGPTLPTMVCPVVAKMLLHRSSLPRCGGPVNVHKGCDAWLQTLRAVGSSPASSY